MFCHTSLPPLLFLVMIPVIVLCPPLSLLLKEEWCCVCYLPFSFPCFSMFLNVFDLRLIPTCFFFVVPPTTLLTLSHSPLKLWKVGAPERGGKEDNAGGREADDKSQSGF
jgi:hypothetical protein